METNRDAVMLDQELCERGFTTSAIEIIQQCFPRAADRGFRIRPDDTDWAALLLLWSLLRWERKLGLVTLEALGVDIDELARDVDRMMRAGPTITFTGSPVICYVRTALAPLLVQAEHEAQMLRQDWIGSEHLLLALIRHPSIALQELWSRHEVSHGRAKSTVIDLLKN